MDCSFLKLTIHLSTLSINYISLSKVDVERRLDTFRQAVEHTDEKLAELTNVYDDVQVGSKIFIYFNV